MEIYKVGYWHSSSEYYHLGYIMAEDNDSAVDMVNEKWDEEIDGIGEVQIEQVEYMSQVMDLEIARTLMLNDEIREELNAQNRDAKENETKYRQRSTKRVKGISKTNRGAMSLHSKKSVGRKH